MSPLRTSVPAGAKEGGAGECLGVPSTAWQPLDPEQVDSGIPPSRGSLDFPRGRRRGTERLWEETGPQSLLGAGAKPPHHLTVSWGQGQCRTPTQSLLGDLCKWWPHFTAETLKFKRAPSITPRPPVEGIRSLDSNLRLVTFNRRLPVPPSHNPNPKYARTDPLPTRDASSHRAQGSARIRGAEPPTPWTHLGAEPRAGPGTGAAQTGCRREP